MSGYWGKDFYSTKNAELKVLWWAIVHSRYGIKDVVIKLRFPIERRCWGNNCKYYPRSLIKIDIPDHLIVECGEVNLNDKCWDIPF